MASLQKRTSKRREGGSQSSHSTPGETLEAYRKRYTIVRLLSVERDEYWDGSMSQTEVDVHAL